MLVCIRGCCFCQRTKIGYELFVTLLGAWSNIPSQAEALPNGSIGLPNQEYLLDLRQNFLYCLLTIASDQNHAVKNCLKCRLPGRIKLSIGRFGSAIVKVFRTSELTGFEFISVGYFLGDT